MKQNKLKQLQMVAVDSIYHFSLQNETWRYKLPGSYIGIYTVSQKSIPDIFVFNLKTS